MSQNLMNIFGVFNPSIKSMPLANLNPIKSTVKDKNVIPDNSKVVSIKEIEDEQIKLDTLGFKNNNPINLKAFEQWDGMKGKDKQGHAIFESLDYGIRAGLKNLRNHQRNNLKQTLQQYLNKFAEANGTQEAKFIADKLGVDITTVLKDLNMDDVIIPMAQFESKIKLTPKDIARVNERFFKKTSFGKIKK